MVDGKRVWLIVSIIHRKRCFSDWDRSDYSATGSGVNDLRLAHAINNLNKHRQKGRAFNSRAQKQIYASLWTNLFHAS